MDDLLSEFLTETLEGLEELDVEIVKLEQTPNDPDLLGSIFRIVHTIKGTCGFLGLPRLQAVAHAGENVLGKYRDGEVEVTADSISLIFAALDTIKMIVGALEETGEEPAGDDNALIDRLNAAAGGEDAPPPEAMHALADEDDAESTQSEDAGDADAAADDSAAPDEAAAAASDPSDGEAEPVAEAKAEEKAPVVEEAPAAAAAGPAVEAPAKGAGPGVAAQSIRVNVDLLENLMTMVSELVLTRNQLMQMMRGREDTELAVPLQRLNHVTSELQEGVMKTRMQPIGNSWSKLPRIVRDLGLDLGKKMDLQMRGEETELDRQVLELIRDPLTHMVRNSCDHGIELPEDRVAAGKPETGRIMLEAHHEGGHIIIRIADDGKGLPLDKIREKAVNSGIVSESQLEAMSDLQIQQLIFHAGLSTAEKVTNVSGRGVGMDVVKTNIEKIGGNVELNSVEGKGSVFTIKIPLTLAIVNALIVEVAEERFAIPQISVTELVRTSERSEHRTEYLNGAPVLRLRDRLLPLFSLRKLMSLGDDEKMESREHFIVVCQVGTSTFGVIVDRVFDTEEIVVKPVAPILRDLSLFSGNTILGDGSVIMILDPNGIAAANGEAVATEVDSEEPSKGADGRETGTEKVAVLLFKGSNGVQKAVPLAVVARLEEFECTSIELSDDQPVVQYREQLMPLVTVDSSCGIREEGRQPVIVFAEGDRSMGLVVDEIVDIVDDELNVELPGKPDSSIIGSATIDGKATEVIDVAHYLTQAFGNWFDGGRGSTYVSGSGSRRLLLVDDSPFFRNLLRPLLSTAGYKVTAVESADRAMELCAKGDQFDIIVSDIEMPGMSGYEFAQAIRGSEEWSDLPVLALSSYTSPEDMERGRVAGFTDYVTKFDRDALLKSLAQNIDSRRGAA